MARQGQDMTEALGAFRHGMGVVVAGLWEHKGVRLPRAVKGTFWGRGRSSSGISSIQSLLSVPAAMPSKIKSSHNPWEAVVNMVLHRQGNLPQGSFPCHLSPEAGGH